MKYCIYFSVFISCCLVLAACQSGAAQPPATSQLTQISTPTQTPVPELPVPEKSTEYLNNVKVTRLDTFNSSTTSPGWGFAAGRIINGVLEVIGKNWNGLNRTNKMNENQGVIIDFTYSKGSIFEVFYDVGDFMTDPYKRFGININGKNVTKNVFSGKKISGKEKIIKNFTLEPDKPYTIMLAILSNGEFLGVIWDPADLSKAITYRETFRKDWAAIPWTFRIGANFGTILFDNYREIVFSAAKQ